MPNEFQIKPEVRRFLPTSVNAGATVQSAISIGNNTLTTMSVKPAIARDLHYFSLPCDRFDFSRFWSGSQRVNEKNNEEPI